jgi:hypothetical protein
MGCPIEVTGHVATVDEKVAGHHLCLSMATVRFHGIDLDLIILPRLWDLHWRDLRPGVKMKVTGEVDARKPRRLAVMVREVALLDEVMPLTDAAQRTYAVAEQHLRELKDGAVRRGDADGVRMVDGLSAVLATVHRWNEEAVVGGNHGVLAVGQATRDILGALMQGLCGA